MRYHSGLRVDASCERSAGYTASPDTISSTSTTFKHFNGLRQTYILENCAVETLFPQEATGSHGVSSALAGVFR